MRRKNAYPKIKLNRVERCFSDNLYLIESFIPDSQILERRYSIMGSKGNVYEVTINYNPYCNCPDYLIRHKRCKHIYFVLMRIMKINNPDKEWFNDEELRDMFQNVPEITNNLIIDNNLKEKYLQDVNNDEEHKDENGIIKQRDYKDENCPICLVPLENGKEIVYCRYSCGKSIHKKCFSMWEKKSGGICVFCRGNWYHKNFSQDDNKKRYVNLLNRNGDVIPEEFARNYHERDIADDDQPFVGRYHRRYRSRDYD